MSDGEKPARRRRVDEDEEMRSSDEGEDLINEDGNVLGSGKGSDAEDDSSEEEEEDPEEARRIAEGFIVDETEDEGDEDDDAERKRRRRERKKRKQKEEEEELDEEDLDLVAEATGQKRRKENVSLIAVCDNQAADDVHQETAQTFPTRISFTSAQDEDDL